VINFVTVPSHFGWQCVKRVANGLFKIHLFIYFKTRLSRHIICG